MIISSLKFFYVPEFFSTMSNPNRARAQSKKVLKFRIVNDPSEDDIEESSELQDSSDEYELSEDEANFSDDESSQSDSPTRASDFKLLIQKLKMILHQ